MVFNSRPVVFSNARYRCTPDLRPCKSPEGWMRTKLQGYHWQESTHIGHFQASEAVIVEPGFPAKYLSTKSKSRSTTVHSLLSRHQFQLALNEYLLRCHVHGESPYLGGLASLRWADQVNRQRGRGPVGQQHLQLPAGHLVLEQPSGRIANAHA